MLVYLLAVSILILLIPTVYADIRDDINSAKAEIKKLVDSIPILENDIISQRNVITGLERDVDIYKEREKDKRQRVGDSWLSFTEHEQASKDLADAQTRLADANIKLQAIIDSKNKAEADIKILEEKLRDLNTQPEPRAEKTGLYSISLDKVCLTYIRNNMTTSCPTYEDVITLFPDTSNRERIGDFSYADGVYQREPAKFLNPYEYYRNWNGVVLFVDPPVEIKTRTINIEIRSSLDEYLLRGNVQTYNNSDNTLTVGTGRWVDEKCQNAYVDSNSWIEWVGDTLYYLSENCDPLATKLDTTKKTQLNKVEHDITTSYKYKLEQFQKSAIEKCGKKLCLYEPGQAAPP